MTAATATLTAAAKRAITAPRRAAPAAPAEDVILETVPQCEERVPALAGRLRTWIHRADCGDPTFAQYLEYLPPEQHYETTGSIHQDLLDRKISGIAFPNFHPVTSKLRGVRTKVLSTDIYTTKKVRGKASKRRLTRYLQQPGSSNQ